MLGVVVVAAKVNDKFAMIALVFGVICVLSAVENFWSWTFQSSEQYIADMRERERQQELEQSLEQAEQRKIQHQLNLNQLEHEIELQQKYGQHWRLFRDERD